MIANFHDSVKNHCQKRGKGCASYPEVQPCWGIVFCLDILSTVSGVASCCSYFSYIHRLSAF